MPAPLIIPFDNNPQSVTVITSSYTVPAGKFARVHYNLEGSSTLTVNGATAVRGTQYAVLGSSAIQYQTQGGFTYSAGGFSSSTNANKLITTNTGDASISNNVPTAAFGQSTAQHTVTGDLFFPTGTVISGAGTWRAVVILYNIVV